jgi:WD40 repeat protein
MARWLDDPMIKFLKLALALTLGGSLKLGHTQDGDRAFAVVRANCLGCHDSKMRAGKLLMETTEDLLKGGTHGPAVIPGKSGESRLVKMILGEIAPKMPLQGELKAEDIEILRQWIDGGAPPWKSDVSNAIVLNVPEIKPIIAVQPQVSSLAFSPDGKSLAAAGYREVRILDPGNLKPRSTLSGPTDMVRAVAYSPDGRILAAAGGGAARYGEVVLWDASSGRQLHTLRGHHDYIYGLAFSPDGKLLASSSYDRLVKLWDVAAGTELKTLKEHTDAVFPVAFSPDGMRIASGGADRTVKIWDVATGKRLFTLSDSTDVVFTLAFHPSGRKVTAAGADKSIRTWNLTNEGGTPAQAIIAHEAEITKIVYFPDGKRLASASADRTVKIWNMETGELIKGLDRQPDWVLGMALSPDGKVLALGRYDGTIGYYDASDGHALPIQTATK